MITPEEGMDEPRDHKVVWAKQNARALASGARIGKVVSSIVADFHVLVIPACWWREAIPVAATTCRACASVL